MELNEITMTNRDMIRAFRLAQYDYEPIKEAINNFYEMKREYVNAYGYPRRVSWTVDRRYSDIIGRLMIELSSDVNAHKAQNVVNFEVRYDKCPEEYVERKKIQLYPALVREWEAAAASAGFYKIYGSVPFFKKLEEILKELQNNSTVYSFKLPNSLEKLSKKKYEIFDIQYEYGKFYDKVRIALAKDKLQLESDVFKSLDGYFNQIRDTDLYKKRCKPSDQEIVGNHTSFLELFYLISYIVADNTLKIEFDEDKESKNDNQNEYFIERVKELPKIKDELNHRRISLLFEKDKLNLDNETQKELKQLTKRMFNDLDIMNSVRYKIKGHETTYNRALHRYYALLEKINAIEETLNSIKSEENANPFNKTVTAFPNTLKVLNTELKESLKELGKYQRTVKIFDSMFEKVDFAIKDFEVYLSNYEEILDKEKNKETDDHISSRLGVK